MANTYTRAHTNARQRKGYTWTHTNTHAHTQTQVGMQAARPGHVGVVLKRLEGGGGGFFFI